MENEVLFPFSYVLQLEYSETWIRRKFHRFLYKLDIRLNRYASSFSKQLSLILEDFQPDIIHCHFGIQSLYLIDNIEHFRWPIVITFHGYDASLMLNTSKVYRERLKSILARKNVFTVFVCSALQKNLHKFGIRTPRSRVIYLGIDTDYFQRYEYSKDSNILFLQVSSFVEKKGHLVTLLAFHKFLKRFPEENAELVFLGDGPLLADILKMIEKLRISEKVKILGHLSPEKVKSYLRMATVFLHHSVTSKEGDQEGIPTSIKEAMCMELPIVSTIHSGIPELITDRVHGFLVPESDLTSYVEKMKEATEMGYLKINRERIINDFNARVQDDKLVNFFSQIILPSV